MLKGTQEVTPSMSFGKVGDAKKTAVGNYWDEFVGFPEGYFAVENSSGTNKGKEKDDKGTDSEDGDSNTFFGEKFKKIDPKVKEEHKET